MISQTVFDKMASAKFSSEQSVCVTQMLFEAAEAGFDKAMKNLEETINNMQNSVGKSIIEAVEATEKKIFARIAQEAAEQEEKKRLRREAIAARKAAKALESAKLPVAAPAKEGGEVAVATDTFRNGTMDSSNRIENSQPNSALKKAKLEKFFKYIGDRVNQATEWATRKELGDYVKVYVAEQRFFAAEEFAENDPDLKEQVELMG